MKVSTYTDISPTQIRDLLDYNPDGGTLFWKPRGSAAFDNKYAGKEAFTATHSGGYRAGKLFGVPIKAHRAIWAIVYGVWPEGEIDHINHDKSDNRLDNLRSVSRQENAKNLGHRRLNRSGRTGVRLVKGKYWIARGVSGGVIAEAACKTFEDACAWRSAFEAKHGFHENHGRIAA